MEKNSELLQLLPFVIGGLLIIAIIALGFSEKTETAPSIIPKL